jgi:hypothetical protein
MIERLAKWWRQRRQDRRDALMFERNICVSFDDVGIRATYPDGTTEAIEWPSVRRIFIETNDSGPWGADFWWVFEGNTRVSISGIPFVFEPNESRHLNGRTLDHRGGVSRVD